MSKNFRSNLFSGSTLLFSCLVLGMMASAFGAQNSAQNSSAGGAWTVNNAEDRMTAVHSVTFQLAGNNDISESGPPRRARGPYDRRGPNGPPPPPPSRDTQEGDQDAYAQAQSRPQPESRPQPDSQPQPESQPRIEIYCEKGEYKAGRFFPGMRIAPPNRPGFWGQPQMEVRVRVNDSPSNHGWNWTPDFLSMDKNTVREVIGGQLVRIQFLGDGGPVISEFSPAGLDLGRMARACSLKPKKPGS